MDDIAQKVQARYAELPADIKQAVEAADLDARVQALGDKHKLHIDQMGKLQNEVLLVMLGFEDSGAFVRNLTSVMGVPPSQATALAADINHIIFEPIRESLKKFTADKSTPTPAALTPAVSAPGAPSPATSAPKPQVPMAPHPHDLMLVEKTVTTPPTPKTPAPPPPKPIDYKTDPYREPPE